MWHWPDRYMYRSAEPCMHGSERGAHALPATRRMRRVEQK